jgi:hypothetical protein
VTAPRDELRSPELLSTPRGRLAAVAFVVLALAVVVIAALRPDRQGVGTPAASAAASSSASLSASPAASPTPSPELNPPAPLGPAPVPPPLTARTGSRLLVVQGIGLDLLDVDSGRPTTVRRFSHAAEYDRLDVVVVGRELVLVGDNNTGAGSGPFPAYATTAGPGSKLRTLGQASYLLRSAHRDRAWLVADNDTNDADAGSTLTEVDLRGVVHQRAHFAHRFGVLPFAGGFLVDAGLTAPGDAGDQGTDLVDARGRVQHHYADRVYRVEGDTAILAASDVPCSRACHLLVLTAGATVVERTVDLAAVPSLYEAGLAPDRSRLLASDVAEGSDRRPGLVKDLDLRTGAVHDVTGAWAESGYGPSFVFSADGRWVFFVDVDGRHVDACDLHSRRSFRVDGDFGRITQLEVLPS